METSLPQRSRRRHLRLTIGGLLALVALTAVFINGFRPVSENEARRIAERRFLAFAGAAWVGRCEARPRHADPYWIVNIINTVTNEPVAQIALDQRGRVRSFAASPPGTVSPTPVDSLSGSLPPPDRWQVDPNGPQSAMAKPTPTPAPR